MFLTSLLVFFSAESYSANFGKGLEAYDAKDFVTARRVWLELAEQGHANA